MKIINFFNQLELGCKNKYKVVSELTKNKFGTIISAQTVKRCVHRWNKAKKLADRPRANKHRLMISNAGMLALNKECLTNPCSTLRKLKEELNLFASLKTISRALHKMGWRHVLTKYCQIIRPVNRLKRFIYTCMAKRFGEEYDDAIFVDECTVEYSRILCQSKWFGMI